MNREKYSQEAIRQAVIDSQRFLLQRENRAFRKLIEILAKMTEPENFDSVKQNINGISIYRYLYIYKSLCKSSF